MTTATISASKLRDNLSSALDMVDGDTVLIVTRRGQPERAIIDIDEYEDLLAASNPEYLASIREARDEVKNGEVFSMEDVFGDL